MKSDAVYLAHIADCINRIEDYVADGREVFMSSRLIQDAVLRNLQTLSEATQRLSDKAKASRSDVDWRSLAAFRNVLVHNYLGIDLELVWVVVERNLPELKIAITEMLAAQPPSGN